MTKLSLSEIPGLTLKIDECVSPIKSVQTTLSLIWAKIFLNGPLAASFIVAQIPLYLA